MAAYIDREAAVESLNAMKPFLRDRGQVQLLRRVMNHIGKIPAADVVPVVHGRWKFGKNHGDFVETECTACGSLLLVKWIDELSNYRYCPNCGARMEVDGND